MNFHRNDGIQLTTFFPARNERVLMVRLSIGLNYKHKFTYSIDLAELFLLDALELVESIKLAWIVDLIIDLDLEVKIDIAFLELVAVHV